MFNDIFKSRSSMLITALGLWFIFTIVSIVVYGFTGHTFWTPLTNAEQDVLRFMILMLVHVFGITAPCVAIPRLLAEPF